MNEQADLPIGIFDSGVGGLTVLHRALKELPHEKFIYYADTDHVPYGIKPKEHVRNYVLQSVSFLNNIGIKAIVIACNTATSIAVQELRQFYAFPVLGMQPAVKPAVERTSGKRVLVLATPLTLREQKFRELVSRVDNENIVDSIPLPELVELAEQFLFDETTVTMELNKHFEKIDLSSYGTVVLGCTHFVFFKNIISKMFPPFTNIIDGNEGTVRHLKSVLESKNLLSASLQKGALTYYRSESLSDAAWFEMYLKLLDKGN